MIKDVTIPDRCRKRAEPEWGVSGEYPCEGAVSIFVDGHLDAQRAQPWQPLEDFGHEQLEGE